MPIRADQLKEKEDYQKLILERLRDDNGFQIRPNTEYKPGLAMDTGMLLEFLEDTQHDTMDQLRRMYKDRTEETIINYINSEINKDSRGLIDVIKHGVEFDNGASLRLMYRKPDSTINTQAVADYGKNIFSVMEEVNHKEDERIDLVIFLNGLAIFAVELKCNTSGQSYEDALKQYKERRDPSTRLFKTRVGVFAAFAMDLNEVYFTTELKGLDTFFNPFNMGENYGKGNPHNDESGINVSYMWEKIWKKDNILFLIERFIYIKKKERKNADTGKTIKTKELIFPRFHQLRAVERVMEDVIINHTSCNYLIEHSAGSGKTETISWLAHILATVHDDANDNIFDTILVITDRIVVDRQLQEAILGIEHKSGQVKVMDDKCDSEDLAIALGGNTKIVVTTIHKFYYILENSLLGNLKDKKFAVLIDEAHSSTEGTYMQSVTTVLTADGEEDPEEADKTEEDKMVEEIQRSGKQTNVSMIAFTATPKPDTIQLFGTLNSKGKKESFDLYSMRQAIEEGYILNVLDNYVTWQTYCHINKAIEDDPEFQSISAKRKMARFIDLHDTNIAQKVEIIIEHFRANVAGCLGGKAKAMVITSYRETAVKYRQEFERYIKAKGYDGIKALVAFSGKVKLSDQDYTEVSMNGIKEEELRYEFDRSCYQVLIVADKYQTGFDQPKLVAMYVDKKIKGVAAVQTLSRLNRVCPPYDKTTFVLDFKNKYEDIKKAFEPYYKDTILFQTISPSDIRDLDKAIDEYEFLDADDIDEFNGYLYQTKRSSKDKQCMWALLDKALKLIIRRPDVEQLEIKKNIHRFLRGYCFLIQATAYENVELHKRYNFLSYLVKEINPGGGGNNFDIADKITVSGFRQKKMEEHKGEEIEAKPEVRINKPVAITIEEQQKKKLSEIIDEVNALYDKDYEPDFTTKAAMQIKDLLLKNEEFKERLKKSAKNNTLEEFKFTYDDCVQDALVEGYDQNADFYTLLLDNEDVRSKFANVFLQEIYKILKEEKDD